MTRKEENRIAIDKMAEEVIKKPSGKIIAISAK